MSMEAIRNNRGAVSIFLILVLVPCIAISCIFVDLSRVQLSKSSAEASADLALNTLLTNYDADLSEYYGLIGSCQNIDDFYTVSAEYFLRTISSQGLSDDEIHLLAGVYANATSDDTIYDLLEVECVSGDKTNLVGEVAGANMGNPAMLKDAVVEFMKYRAPIEIATTLIARLKASASEVKQLEEADSNDELVEQKEEFYEAEGELMKAAVYSYKAIEAYVNEVGWTDQNTMKQDAAKIDSYRKAYEEIHTKSVKYLLNTGKLTKAYLRFTLNIDEYQKKIEKLSSAYSSTGTAEDGTTIYYLNGNKLDAQIETATRAITALNTAVNSYVQATNSLMQQWKPAENGYNEIQWWVDMDNAVFRGAYGNVHKDVAEAGEDVLMAYQNIKAMMEGCEKEPKPENADQTYKELPDDWKTTCQNKLNELRTIYDKYLNRTPTNSSDPYIVAANALETVSYSTDNLNKIKPSSHTVSALSNMQIETAVTFIAQELNSLHAKYDKIIEKLDVAIDGDGDKVKSLDDLLALAKTYNDEFKEYNSAAQSSTTTMGGDERNIIEKDLKLQQEINEESVRQLKTRLENIRDQFCVLRSKIQTLTYGGEPIREITSFSAFKAAAKAVITDSGNYEIPRGQTALDNKVSNWFDEMYKPAEGSEIKLEHTDDDNYHPDLLVNTPALYAYMRKQFQGVNLADVEKEAENEKDVKDKQEKDKAAAESKATTYRGKADAKMPANFATEGVFGVTDMLTSIIDLVKDLVKVADGGATRIRDDLFVTTYAMEMFSYATFDREAMYRNMSEDARKNMTPADAYAGIQYYKDNNVYGDPAGDLEAQDKMWVSTKETDTFNKSLTNKMIDLNNNHVYLAEVEYLLYGQADPVQNLKKAYGDIYAIRFTLNTISAFHHFWGTSNDTGFFLENVAIAISSFTGYVVPAKVIKAVLLPILAAAESCKDNQRLFAGMPVELYKMEENDWWYSLEGKGDGNGLGYSALYDLISGDAGDKGKNKDQGLFYSDYMTLFVYCGFTHNETSMYRRLGSLIEANMHTVLSNKSGKSENYSLTKTRMYFSLKADLRVKPLMVTIPYYLDEYDTSGMRTATDWCTYKIDIVRGYS